MKGKGLVFTDLQGDRHLKCDRVITSAVGLRGFFFEGAEDLMLLVKNPSSFWLAASKHLTEAAPAASDGHCGIHMGHCYS